MMISESTMGKIVIPIVILYSLAGCKPAIQEVESVEETSMPEETSPKPPIIQVVDIEARDARIMAETRLYSVITDPWSKYFRADPTLILLPKLSKGVEDLLNEQQQKAREILSNTGQLGDRPEYIQLEEELESLKSAVPGAETRSGYGRSYRRSYSPSYSYVSSDGSTAYVRSGGSSSYYYTVFNRVHKSSSPALARSVENIIYNASLEDLDQRIEALRQLHRTWSRKTNVMSPNGVEGIMREANQAYLDGIRGYTSEIVQLQSRLKRVQALIDAESAKKESRLEEWQSFEANRLPVIGEYVERHTKLQVAPKNGNYEVPAALLDQHVVLLACTIGERTLYFDLRADAHAKHPFRLVAMGE
jgi:hypothetical protein